MFLTLLVVTILSAGWFSVAGMSGIGTTFDHPAVEAMAAVEAGLADLREASLWSLPVAELGRMVERAETLAHRLAFLQMELTAQAETQRLAEREGATSLVALLRARADGELTAAGGQVPGRYHGVVRAGFLAAIRPSQALDAMLRSLQAPAPGDAFDPLDLLLPLGETLMRATERPGSVLPGTTMGLAGLLAGRGHDAARAVVNLARERSVVWPHQMRGHLEALPGLVDHPPRAEGPPASPPRDPLDDRCARQLARQVRELGMTFLTDPDPGDDDLAVHAMAVRVGALTLAELTAGNPLGDEATHACLSIAAGVTIVQDRAEGRIQPNEALMLVRT